MTPKMHCITSTFCSNNFHITELLVFFLETQPKPARWLHTCGASSGLCRALTEAQAAVPLQRGATGGS